MSLDYNEKNITLAKNLRKNATPQENHLWYDFLSKYEIRFQRQKAIDNGVVFLRTVLLNGITAKSATTARGSLREGAVAASD